MLTGPKYHCSNVITGLLRDRRRGRREETGKKRSKGCCTVYDMASWNVCSSLDPPPHHSTCSHMDLKARRGRDRSVFTQQHDASRWMSKHLDVVFSFVFASTDDLRPSTSTETTDLVLVKAATCHSTRRRYVRATELSSCDSNLW